VKIRLQGEEKPYLLADNKAREPDAFPGSSYRSLELFDQSDEGGYMLRRPKKD